MKLNPRPVYNNPQKPVVNNNVNKFPRLTNQEWDDIIMIVLNIIFEWINIIDSEELLLTLNIIN